MSVKSEEYYCGIGEDAWKIIINYNFSFIPFLLSESTI